MLSRFIFILCAFLLVGMLTVWQKGQSTHAGYEVSRLISIKDSLERRNKRLRIESERLKLPDTLLGDVERLGLKLHAAGPDELIEIGKPGSKIESQDTAARERGESCRSQE